MQENPFARQMCSSRADGEWNGSRGDILFLPGGRGVAISPPILLSSSLSLSLIHSSDHFRFSFSIRVTNFEAIQRFGL